jgi:hypothetical protein
MMGTLLATAIDDLPLGIERVGLPVPFPVGPVNYLLLGETRRSGPARLRRSGSAVPDQR